MSMTAQSPAVASPRLLTARKLSTEALRGRLLWLMGFAGAFVFIEPSPYEVVCVIAIGFFALTGLSLRASLAPLMILLVLLNIGYATSLLQVVDQPKLVTWVLVSVFLAFTAIFYASVIATNTQVRLDWLMRGVLAAGVISSLVAVGAYFHLFGGVSDMFVLFGRARGTFNDPNVLGAFLVLPGLLAFQRVMSGRRSSVIVSGSLLLVMLAALFLSFSRAAWGQFALAAMLLMGMTFLTSRSSSERLRIATIAIAGAVTVVVLVIALLSIDQVAELFKQRASLEQSYDVGPLGRFGRYSLGFELALDRPFGIGPLQFSHYFPEDPHNTLLNSFMAGGWLAGFSFLTLTLVTVTWGFRYVFVRTPWQSAYHVIYATYLGIVAECAIIDIDHWRHYFLVLGLLWGLMAVTRNYLAQHRAPA
jgi:hypothetical protein